MQSVSLRAVVRVRSLVLAVAATCATLSAYGEEATLPAATPAESQSQRDADAGGARQADEVVVVATRTAMSLNNVPASVSAVAGEDFRQEQAETVGDVLKDLPNVDFGGGARINGQIPTIRGYYGPSVMLMVDGARRNDVQSPGMRSPLYVNPYFLNRVEVLRGSASSLYGSGGNGGAMVFTTLSATDLLEADQGFGAGASVGRATANQATTEDARVYGRSGVVDGLIAVGHEGWSKIRQGDGTYLEPNDGHSDSALLKVGATGGGLRYEVSHQRYDSKNFQPRNPQADSTLPGAPVVSMNHVHQHQTVARAARAGDAAPPVSVTIYQTDLQVIDDQGANAVSTPYAEVRTRTIGGSVQGTVSFAGAQRVTAGIDGYEDKQSALSGSAPNPVNPDGKRAVTGMFIEGEFALGGGWSLIPSVRRDGYQTSMNSGAETPTFYHTSPKLTASWRPSTGSMVYASYGEAFRAPTINEMYSDITGTNYFMNFRPNPDLKPEVDTTREIGGAYRYPFASDNALSVRAAYFSSKAKDLISNTNIGSYARTAPYVGTGFIWQAQNVSSALRKGGEIEINHDVGNWQTHLGYSRLRVVDADTYAGLYSPPDKVNLRLRWKIPAAGISLLWNSTATMAQDYDATTLRRRPGYTVHDVYTTWESPRQHYRVDAGVSNLFDKRYADYQSSMAYANTPQEGRNLKVTLSAEF